MRNLNSFIGDSKEFLDEVIKSKKNSSKDPYYKNRIEILTPNIKLLFNSYNQAYQTKSYVNLSPFGYLNQEKIDLLKLYTSKNSQLVKLKNTITTIFDNRAMNTCQYCSIAPVGSLDHIIPKDDFPEYAVNPKNLLPACSTCNSHKGNRWIENNKPIFLNLYTDILPKKQYLFVELTITPENIQTRFILKNINNIDAILFQILESHYYNLNLPDRFMKESHKIISELSNLIKGSQNLLSKDDLIKIVNKKIIEDKITFGYNYYKSILEEALINNKKFLNSF